MIELDKSKFFYGSDGTDDNHMDEPKDNDNDAHKPTDAEAKLLKEVMAKKEQIKKQEAELAEVKQQLQQINDLGGLDMLKQLADEKKKLEEQRKAEEAKKLEEKGEWEKLKAQMVDEHTKSTENYRKEIDELKSKLSSEQKKISELTVGSAFNSSAYLKEKTILTPSKARIIYGDYFDIDENGNVVGYDKPRGQSGRVALVDQLGANVDFETAIQRIIDKDPDRDRIVRSSSKNGAGSRTEGLKKSEEDSHDKQLTGVQMILAGLSKSK